MFTIWTFKSLKFDKENTYTQNKKIDKMTSKDTQKEAYSFKGLVSLVFRKIQIKSDREILLPSTILNKENFTSKVLESK